MWYTIISLSGVCEVGGGNHSKITTNMRSGEQEFLIPVQHGFESFEVKVAFFINMDQKCNYEFKKTYVHT